MSSYKTKYLISILLLFFNTTCAFAQYDTIVKRMQREFDTFKKEIEQQHYQFKSRNDSIFSAFLKDSWESFNVFFNQRPERPKPQLQPVAPQPRKGKDKTNPEEESGTGWISNPPDVKMRPEKSKGQPEFEMTGNAPVMVDFYGSTLPLFMTDEKIFVPSVNHTEIERFFDLAASSLEVEKLLLQLTIIKKNLLLNDWGYLKLVEAVSGKLFNRPVEQTLISWVLLLKSGFNAKIGYAKGQVWLLVPSFQEMNKWFMTIDEKVYYILKSNESFKSFPELTIHKADYPGALPVSLTLTQLPETGKELISKEMVFKGIKVSIRVNRNLVRFFDDYPLTRLGIYFLTPLSEDILQPLEILFKPLLKELTPLEKTTVLLEFVQKSFAYKTDKEQFGREKFFFPDELFWYPYADCEDRSVLFCRLLMHFTGLECAALEFPGHITTAVLLPGKTSGSTITIDGQAYTVCDPTYRNAWPGFLAAEYKGIKPEIITFK